MLEKIDLNCDMGEGYTTDALIMPLISSANIACGYHAGGGELMRQTIRLALQHGVAIGAHPSFEDKEGFGRREMHLSSDEIYQIVLDQVNIMRKAAAEEGAKLHHVKPHGALYNTSAKNEVVAKAIAKAVKDVDTGLILFGLKNSHSIAAAKNIGLNTAEEAFADRRYESDGSLTPRSQPGACLTEIRAVLDQVKKIKADTWCIHGDGPHAVDFAKALHELKTLQ